VRSCCHTLFAALLCVMLSLPAHAVNPCALATGGMGGTGAPAPVASDDSDEGGMGGTGLQADQGGIGGTGQRAEGGIGGTGIVGVITGFGSICVGGVQVRYGTQTPISYAGKPIAAGDLKIGHVVQVRAMGAGDSVRASAIELTHVISGPVRRIDRTTNQLDVMGQTVRATPQLIEQAREAVRLGEPVQISGLRDSAGTVVATRVDAAPGLREFSVQGEMQVGAGRRARVGNLDVSWRPEHDRNVGSGQTLEIRGLIEDGVLRARVVEQAGAAALRNDVQRLVIEGYVREKRGDRVRVGDTDVSVDATLSASAGGLERDQRVVVSMRVDGEHLVAERVERVRDREQGRDRGKDRHDKDQESADDPERERKEESDLHKDELKGDSTRNDVDVLDRGDEGKARDKSRESSRDRDRDDPKADRRSTEDSSHGGGRDADRPLREPKPPKPDRGSSHGGRENRTRDK